MEIETMESVDLDVDIKDLPDSDALPVGRYKFRIDEYGTGIDKKDNGFYKFKYSVIEGEYATREVRENYVPAKGRAILKKILRAVQWKHKNLTRTNRDELIGMEFTAITKIESSDDFGDQTRIAVYLDPNATVTQEGGAPV